MEEGKGPLGPHYPKLFFLHEQCRQAHLVQRHPPQPEGTSGVYKVWSLISTPTLMSQALLASTAWVIMPSRLPWQYVKSNLLSLCTFLFFPMYKSLKAHVILLHNINRSFSFCRSSDVLISLLKLHFTICSCDHLRLICSIYISYTWKTCNPLYGMLCYLTSESKPDPCI